MIQAKDIIKIYKGPIGNPEKTVVALNSVTVKIERNEIIAIVGESGAGKTTFLNIIIGLLDPDSGIVIVKNQSLYSLDSKSRNIFRAKHFYYIHQNMKDNLFYELTGKENIEIELIAKDINQKSKSINEGMNNIIKELNIKFDLNIPVSKLSGGEKQILCFCKALINNPEIIILDEPTSALDQNLKIKIMKFFISIAKKAELTLIFTTHDPEIAIYADKIIGISEGKFDRVLNSESEVNNINMLNKVEDLMIGKFIEIPLSHTGTLHLPKPLLKKLGYGNSVFIKVEKSQIVLSKKKESNF